MLLRRRGRRVAAVVGLLAGLALLLGAVLDGGMASPTRTDPAGVTAAVPHAELGASAAPAREDQPAWDAPDLPIATAVVVIASGLAVLAAAVVVSETAPRRAPALLADRHRGPPVRV